MHDMDFAAGARRVLIRWAIALAVLGVIATAAQSQVMKIESRESDDVNCAECAVSIGSATIVGYHDGAAVMLTANHVVDGGRYSRYDVRHKGRLYSVAVVQRWADNDVAIVEVAGLTGVKCATLGPMPAANTTVELAGYPLGAFKRYVGKLLQRSRYVGTSEHTAYVEHGTSGGPVGYKDSQGRVITCGVVSARDPNMKTTICSPIEQVQFWCRAHYQTWPLPCRPAPRTVRPPPRVEMPAPPVAQSPPVDLSPIHEQIASLQAGLTQLRKRKPVDLSGIHKRIDDLANAPIAPNPPMDKPEPEVEAGDASENGIDWTTALTSAGIVAAGATGVGLPAWGLFALNAARRLRNRRREEEGHTEAAQHTNVVDAPNAPIRTRTNTQFVNVESDKYQRAHEWARQEIVRRYPGSQEMLEAELSLTRQAMSGQT